MSRDTYISDSPLIESRQALVAFFAGGEKPPSRYRVGTETEKLAYRMESLSPVAYEEGIQQLLQGMISLGWTPEPDAERPLALVREGASITLEPGGQVELSGAPLASIHDTAEELRGHLAELELHPRFVESEGAVHLDVALGDRREGAYSVQRLNEREPLPG